MSTADGPAVAVGPGDVPPVLAAAVVAGGGRPVAADDAPADAQALVWTDFLEPAALARRLAEAPAVRWVQLPVAGVEAFRDLFGDGRLWTCAKGAYAEPVAEHALALGLAGLRRLPTRARAREWGAPAGTSLMDGRVTVLGGGGITEALLGLLAPFRVEVTVVRRSSRPLAGAARVLPPEARREAVADAQLVVLALALTPETVGIVGEAELAAMAPGAWLVNVARGAHVVTDDLVAALRGGAIGGAALDVTDPEPLPPGHPLWELDNCLVTPHVADTWEMAEPLLARRVRENVERYRAGAPLVGVVDPDLGY